jgi:hypothetical protein
MSHINYAGYGVYDQTIDVTGGVQQEYNNNQRVFTADNRFGDPASGQRKYLYILWTNNGVLSSGVVGENDSHGITIP